MNNLMHITSITSNKGTNFLKKKKKKQLSNLNQDKTDNKNKDGKNKENVGQ